MHMAESNNRHERKVVTLNLASCLVLVGLFVGLGTAEQSLATNTVLIRDVTIISAERIQPIPGTSVLIEDGLIVAIGTNLRRTDVGQEIDGAGRFLIPGLIDSHVHLAGSAGIRGDQRQKNILLLQEFHRREPLNYLAFGFTTLIDVSSSPAYARTWNELALRPDLHFCAALPFANGYGMAFESVETRFEAPFFLYDPQQANVIPTQYKAEEHTPHAVLERIARTEAVCVKTYYETGFAGLYDFPVPPVELIADVVKEAHANNLTVLMHGNSLEAQHFAAIAGVDALAHGAWHWGDWNGAEDIPEQVRHILDEIIGGNIGYQSTAQVIYGERDLFDPQFLNDPRLEAVYGQELLNWYRSEDAGWFRRQLMENYRTHPELIQAFIGKEPDGSLFEPSNAAISRLARSVSYLAANGATFLFGTDSPSSPAYTNPPGYNGLIEIRRLADFGVSERLIFEALTINNARAFNLDHEIGTVEVGKRANLLLLRKNPLETIAAYDSIDTIVLNGRPIARNSLLLPLTDDQ
jgi:imidazolonepropionase-like amidohydrolase